MNVPLNQYRTVSQLCAGQQADVVGMAVSEKIQERLAGLGLNMGARFSLIQGGGGVPFILAVDETRVAMGKELAEKIYIKCV